MTPYTVAASGDTPGIEFNASKGIFMLSGKSLPENADEFFDPAIKWIRMYRESPNAETKLICKLEYFNTASSKKILDLLHECKLLSGKVSVVWHYLADDDDMKDIGKEFADLVGLPFSFVVEQSF